MKLDRTDGSLLAEGPETTMRGLVERLVREGANLQDANLQDADLQGADLQGADLWGANLTGVLGLGTLAAEIMELRAEVVRLKGESK